MNFLETDRLILRNLELEDAASMYDYRNKEICNKYQRWTAFQRADIESFIVKFKDDIFLSTKSEQHFGVCKKDTSEFVGELAYFYEENDCITLGISISYRYHRQGVAYEMLEEVIRLIRKQYPTMDIVGLIDKENNKSIGLFKKLGFQRECYAETISSYIYVLGAREK